LTVIGPDSAKIARSREEGFGNSGTTSRRGCRTGGLWENPPFRYATLIPVERELERFDSADLKSGYCDLQD
jgi:hypothetical protein